MRDSRFFLVFLEIGLVPRTEGKAKSLGGLGRTIKSMLSGSLVLT